jgi:hypothetical protein
MTPELLTLRSLLTEDERVRFVSLQLGAGTLLVATFGAFIGAVFMVVVSVYAVGMFAASAILALLALRSATKRDMYDARLVARLTERLQDEVFLRYRVIPTREIRLGREADFVTLDDQTVRGTVQLDGSGTPQFLQVYAPHD